MTTSAFNDQYQVAARLAGIRPTTNRPFDIVNLRLEVPTVKGAKLKAPSYMTFEVTSEQQEEVGPFLAEVKKLVHDVGLVYVQG